MNLEPRISLPVANLGEIPGNIAPRFLPPWICFSARNLARFAVGFRRDFNCRDYCFPARIWWASRQDRTEILAAGIFASRRESWQDSRQDPGEILAAGIFASRQESWRDWKNDPGEILAAGNFTSRRQSCRDPGEIPAGKKNPGGQNLAGIGIPVEISAGSRQDTGPYFTRSTIITTPLSLSLSTVHYTSTVNISPFSWVLFFFLACSAHNITYTNYSTINKSNVYWQSL